MHECFNVQKKWKCKYTTSSKVHKTTYYKVRPTKEPQNHTSKQDMFTPQSSPKEQGSFP